MSSPASLSPVRGSAAEILGLLRDWDAAVDPEPLVVETSGSTGQPKRVVLSRAAMRASADATHARLGGPGQWLLALPPTYVAGLQVLFRSIRAGTEPVESVDAMTGLRRYLSLVPTQLTRMLDTDPQAQRRFDAVLVGGARLEPRLRARAQDAGLHVVATYGMSETCGGCVYDGVPLDDVEVRVGDDGRIRLGGPVVFDGYDAELGVTAEVKEDGWFVTADLGRIADDGRLEVLGRVDDVVVSGGVNVPAGAVAARLREHPDVRDAEVVGVPDEQWGRAVVAVAQTEATLGSLRDWVAEQHPRTFAPRRLVRVGSLPLLANGKVDRLAVERLGGAEVFAIEMRTRFRGITVREGMLLRGDAGWGEFSPFLEYDARVAEPWLRAARESADEGWPAALRQSIPVNVTVPAVGPEQAAETVLSGNGCRTAKVKVAEPGQSLADEQARLEAVRDALGPDGRIRIDANGLWSLEEALTRIPLLDKAAGRLEYVEQPCESVEDLAAVRRKTQVRVAADESIRRAEDPYRVRDLEAADVAVLKVQPLGGVRACLRIAEDIGMPVVVSSALETSVGIAAGVALAAALPELPFACGLATVQLLSDDVVAHPLLPVDGELPVTRPDVDAVALDRTRAAPDRERHWQERLAAVGQDHRT